jgi:hypothetical protein
MDFCRNRFVVIAPLCAILRFWGGGQHGRSHAQTVSAKITATVGTQTTSHTACKAKMPTTNARRHRQSCNAPKVKMSESEQLSELISQMYDASLDAALWNGVVKEIANSSLAPS